MERRFPAQHSSGPAATARVLVTPWPFSARYDLDRRAGVFSRTGHPLLGTAIKNRILVSTSVQGGVAAGWAFLALAQRGQGFAGFVFSEINPVMVQGAVTAGLPIASGVDSDFFTNIKSGDTIRIDPASSTVIILDESSLRLNSESPNESMPNPAVS